MAYNNNSSKLTQSSNEVYIRGQSHKGVESGGV